MVVTDFPAFWMIGAANRGRSLSIQGPSLTRRRNPFVTAVTCCWFWGSNSEMVGEIFSWHSMTLSWMHRWLMVFRCCCGWMWPVVCVKKWLTVFFFKLIRCLFVLTIQCYFGNGWRVLSQVFFQPEQDNNRRYRSTSTHVSLSGLCRISNHPLYNSMPRGTAGETTNRMSLMASVTKTENWSNNKNNSEATSAITDRK